MGYFKGEDDPHAIAFSLGDYLPNRPRSEDTPLRVIGTGYTDDYSVELRPAPRPFATRPGNCTACHTLTNPGHRSALCGRCGGP